MKQAVTCFTVTPALGVARPRIIPRGLGSTPTPAPASLALRLDLQVTKGAYDLYVKSGSVASLADADKVNVGAVSGGLNYVLVNPGTGAFTVAVVRTSMSGEARLEQPKDEFTTTLKCSGAACTVSSPLTSIPGHRYGDQAVFPVDISTAGRVEVKVTWAGTVRLSAILYGPTVSRKSVTRGSLARNDGASPLTLTYDVRSTNLISGGKWSVGLSNAGKAGGTITSGTVSISYSR